MTELFISNNALKRSKAQMDRFSAAKLQFENDLIKSGQENIFFSRKQYLFA